MGEETTLLDLLPGHTPALGRAQREHPVHPLLHEARHASTPVARSVTRMTSAVAVTPRTTFRAP